MKKIKNKIIISIAAVGLVILINNFSMAQSGIKRTDLQQHDLSVTGLEVIQATVELDPGSEAPNHKHPGEEIIYVLEGLLEYQVEGMPPVTLKAGEVLFIPKGTGHSAKNVGDVKAIELATYIVEKDKPLITLIK